MKKKLLILTSVLGAIAVFAMLTAGSFDRKGGKDAYQAVLSEILKSDTQLAKFLNKSETVLSKTNVSTRELEYLLKRLKNYYTSAKEHAERIQDEELKTKVLQALDESETSFEAKRNSAENRKETVERLVTELKDLNLTISILATIPTQQGNEDGIKEKVDAVEEYKSDLNLTIKEAEGKL